jgi:signal transduction histidine kinase
MAETDELEWLAARGAIASGVAIELAGPLESVYAKLAKAVERLDRHVATSRGPEPLPVHAVGEIRERIADVFLDVGRVRRLAASLAALSAPPAARPSDLNDVVELALVLARHGFAPECETLLDLATLPPIVIDRARLAQALALLLVHAARAAGAAGTVAIRTEGGPAQVRLAIEATCDHDRTAEPLPFAAVLAAVVGAEGGQLAVRVDSDQLIIEVFLPRGIAVR